MSEKELDVGILKSLIELYREVDLEIQSFGEEALRKISPSIIERKDKLRKYIVDYVKSYFPEYVSENYMDVLVIEEKIIKNIR